MMKSTHSPTSPASSRPARRRQRGQSLVIFSLVAVVLFGVIGFAVDGGFSFFVSDRLERGAMAASLAGVTNMPNYSTAPNDAVDTAVKAAGLNGWANGGATNVAITVSQVLEPPPAPAGTYFRNRLSVTIAADVPVFFMKLLGFGTHRESRTVVAEYLRPITFGQPGNQIGSDLTSLGSGNNYYFMRSEGWGTDRGQGDAYGPNPSDWGGGWTSVPNTDVHSLSATALTDTSSNPGGGVTLPARGGQNYQIYVPNGQSGYVQVYNPVFAPDNGATAANGYNYHEDDTDFPETGTGCNHGGSQGTSPCAGPSNVQQWPIMSYTLFSSPNPFDHTADVWLSNLTVKSIDAANSPSTGKYAVAGTTSPLFALGTLQSYHQWIDIAKPPSDSQDTALETLQQPTAMDAISSASPTGSTFRLRVDQLDNLTGDPGANGRGQGANSQAHKGYSVRISGCAGCTVTALDDVTLYTPVKGGGAFQMPLVSIPPEYAGRTFSLFIYDLGDVGCNPPGQCSNVVSVLRPNGVGNPEVTAGTSDGVFEGQSGEAQATYANIVAGPGSASVQTQDPNNNPHNIYNGKWLRFDVVVPTDYATSDIDQANPATWFWNLSYSTALDAGDTFTANLGYTGAPVHIVSG
jgi:nitrate reductase NapE component